MILPQPDMLLTPHDVLKTPPRVLVVDDDRTTRHLVAEVLVDGGYAVLEADSGEAALDVLASHPVLLVVLDIMLPGMDGYQVCRTLRDRGEDVGILMLSLKGEAADRVHGLEQGADDYLVKPFHPAELLARVRAIHRRRRPQVQEEGITFRDLRLAFRTQRCFRGDQEVDLTPTEFMLLAELLRQPGQVRTREELCASLWGEGHFGSPKALDVYIRRLREKVEVAPSEPAMIMTVRGKGYVCE